MAAEESDREDLLREATGLVDRIELTVAWLDEPLVAGFRINGALSLFLGQAEVYQFDTQCRWRRGYYQGQLLKAVNGQLVQMHRQRGPAATELISRPLTHGEQQVAITRLTERLRQLEAALHAQAYSVVGQVAVSADTVPLPRLTEWLRRRPPVIEVASTPRVR